MDMIWRGVVWYGVVWCGVSLAWAALKCKYVPGGIRGIEGVCTYVTIAVSVFSHVNGSRREGVIHDECHKETYLASACM